MLDTYVHDYTHLKIVNFILVDDTPVWQRHRQASKWVSILRI